MTHEFKPSQNLSRDRERRARRIYYTTWASVFGGFMLGGPMLALTPGQPLPGWYFGFAYLFMGLASQAATWACRRAGVSLESSPSQKIQRDPRAALVPFLSQAPEFELGHNLMQRARVDREGIESSRRHRVLWRDVVSCTSTSPRNAMGNALPVEITLHAHDGKALLHLAVSEEDAQRLLPAIGFYLCGEDSSVGPAL